MKYRSGKTFASRLRLPRLSQVADAATILALCIAFYAFVRPAAVSDYLSAVAENTASSSKSLARINTDTGAINVATGQLVAEIPVWLRFAEVEQADLRQHAFKHSANNLSFRFLNASNTLFADVNVTVLEEAGGRFFEEIRGIAIPPGEELKLNVDIKGAASDTNLVCISAINDSTGERLTEVREIRRSGRGPTCSCGQQIGRWNGENRL